MSDNATNAGLRDRSEKPEKSAENQARIGVGAFDSSQIGGGSITTGGRAGSGQATASAKELHSPALTTPDAAAVKRGIQRLFARNDIWCLAEMPLRNNRRSDLMGVDSRGKVVIVEIKVSRADLMGDGKWQEYLDYCDKFYWGLPQGLDRGLLDTPDYLPESCGVILADGYDAEILRPAPSVPLAAARRKVEVERLARTALRRLSETHDPDILG